MTTRKVTIFLATALGLASATFAAEDSYEDAVADLDLFKMSLSQLMDVEVSLFTLTDSSIRSEPVISTLLDDYVIGMSGARTIDDLQEMVIPNMQVLQAPIFGISGGYRGINNAGNTEYFTALNGRIINSRLTVSFDIDRRVPLLGDIERMDVIRGPGSILFGPGPLSSVTHLRTHTGHTFEGADVKLRHVLMDQLSAAEVRVGKLFSPDHALFLYAGIAYRPGADVETSPMVFGHDFTLPDGREVRGGEDSGLPFIPNHQYRKPMVKFFGDWSLGDFKLWARYIRLGVPHYPTYASLQTVEEPPGQAPSDFNPGLIDDGSALVETQQMMVVAEYNQEHGSEWKTKSRLAFDWGLNEDRRTIRSMSRTPEIFRQREYEINARFVATWKPNDQHQIAMGIEGAHEWFKEKTPLPLGPPTGGPITGTPSSGDTSLAAPTNIIKDLSYGPMLEYQWRPTKWFAGFAGIRADKVDSGHNNDWEFSPRLALVFTPSDEDTLKLIGSHSVQRPLGISPELDKETMTVVDLHYQRQQNEDWLLGGGLFFQRLDAISGSNVPGAANVGIFDMGGVEIELNYRSENTILFFSHTWTKLLKSDMDSDIEYTVFSAEPVGYGDDLGSWSPHQTKLLVIHEISDSLTVNASSTIYWGFPGMKDLVRFNTEGIEGGPIVRLGIDEGNDDAFGPNAYVNCGVQYSMLDWLETRLDLYNILGWVDETLNKRNFRDANAGSYRVESPAVGFTVQAQF